MTHVFTRHADGRPFFQEAVLDNHAHDNGVSAVEDVLRHDLQLAREDRHVLKLLLLLLQQLIAVLRELVKQMVDDVGGEDGHAQTVSQLLDIPLHFHVKSQDDSVPAKRQVRLQFSAEQSPTASAGEKRLPFQLYYFLSLYTVPGETRLWAIKGLRRSGLRVRKRTVLFSDHVYCK